MLPRLRKRDYNRRVDKRNLRLVPKTDAPDTPQEQVRKRLRKTKIKEEPQCPTCGGRSYTTVQTGIVKQKWCAFCMMQGRMVIMI
jgi:hypothetical protein